MPRHFKDETDDERYRPPGRPAIDPMLKASELLRCLISPTVKEGVLQELQKIHGLNESDILRYGLFLLIKKDGLTNMLVEDDNTWKPLRDAGLI